MDTSFINQIIQKSGKKVYIYFATKSYGEDYDERENNVTLTNLPPQVIKAYVQQISPEALVWKQYGLVEIGAVELLCEAKYKEWFKKANRITIDGADYSVFSSGGGKNALIQDRPFNAIRVILQKKV